LIEPTTHVSHGPSHATHSQPTAPPRNGRRPRADAVRHAGKGFGSSGAALRGSFGFYRAWDATTKQNEERQATKLTMPVLAIGGAMSSGDNPRALMQIVANHVQGLSIPGAGHFVAEEAPEQMIAALTRFLAPYATEVPRGRTLARSPA
jgi:pimeloyl-ACP methyl ester carboxylesterase